MRAYERPLLAFDRDDWAYVIPSASEADGHLEPVDVEDGEYQVDMLDGRVVEAVVIDGRVALRESDQRDVAGLHARLGLLVRRYELGSAPDDPVAVANELLRRDWESGPVMSWLRRSGRRRHDGPDIVQPSSADTGLIDLLRERDGRPTVVELHDGRNRSAWEVERMGAVGAARTCSTSGSSLPEGGAAAARGAGVSHHGPGENRRVCTMPVAVEIATDAVPSPSRVSGHPATPAAERTST